MWKRQLTELSQTLRGRSFATLPSPAKVPTVTTGQTEIQQRILPFDTYRLAERLEREGFTVEQSAVVVQCLRQCIQNSTEMIDSQMITMSAQQRINSLSKVDFAQLKAEIKMLERNDFALLKSENERMAAEVAKMQQKFREDINRVMAGNRLDINLEKGKLWDEQSRLTAELRETEAKIEQEMTQLRAGMQQVKFDTIRTLLTTASTLGLIVLGYMRLFK